MALQSRRLRSRPTFTQSAIAAVEQYKNDRLPIDPITRRVEPLLTFKRGAVVHFAMSDSDIQMATKLAGADTFFLPFNLGSGGHAGNPLREDGEYPVAYFWEQVCQPDNWLRIFHSFAYTERKEYVDLAGNHRKKETLIFPRFHQWDAVTKMIADARANGPGLPYLCEHSAGSGKTSTIAWTAHDLVRLRTAAGANLFHSVIVVTDRTVLDKQLQDAVQQIDHQQDIDRSDRRQGHRKEQVRRARRGAGAPDPHRCGHDPDFPIRNGADPDQRQARRSQLRRSSSTRPTPVRPEQQHRSFRPRLPCGM